MDPQRLALLYDAFRDIIEAEWSEVALPATESGKARGIHRSEDVSIIPYEKLEAPYCILNPNPEVRRMQNMSIDGQDFEVDMGVFYVKPSSLSQDELTEKLINLQRKLEDPTLTDFTDIRCQVFRTEFVAFSVGLQVNAELIKRQIKGVRAGLLVVTCWIHNTVIT